MAGPGLEEPRWASAAEKRPADQAVAALPAHAVTRVKTLKCVNCFGALPINTYLCTSFYGKAHAPVSYETSMRE